MRTRPRALANVAVPLALVALLVAGCGEPADAGDPAGTPDAPTSTTSEPTSAPSSGPDQGAEGEVADEESAYAVVDAWLAATATGDPTEVGDLLGPTSLRAVESMGGIEVLLSGLAEGMSTYAQPGMQRAAIEMRPGAWLVTYSGEREVEGTTEWSARSFVVVGTDDGPRIETFVHPLPELESPADPLAATAADVVTVTLPAGGEPLAYLDGSTEVATTSEPVDGDQVRVSAAPEGGLPAGTHAVTVVVAPGASADLWAATTVALDVTG